MLHYKIYTSTPKAPSTFPPATRHFGCLSFRFSMCRNFSMMFWRHILSRLQDVFRCIMQRGSVIFNLEETSSSIIKLLMLMWTSWSMLEPLHEPSWKPHIMFLHVATDSPSQWYTLQKDLSKNITTKCGYMWIPTWTIIQSCLTPYPAAWSPQHPQAVQHLPELAVTAGM